ncbi:MAG: BTAD domain-containing putative transcriptional regulator [Solirubrobacteraceae bacterium]
MFARTVAAVGVLLMLTALAALALFRPSLPHIVSLTAPLTAETLRGGALCLAWLLAVYVALALLIPAARVLIHGPAWQREAILPGVIPGPAPPQLPTPLSERFQPRILAPPLDLDLENTHPAAPAKAPIAAPTHEKPRPVSICLLGPLRIEGTDRPPRRVRTRELIAYLALHPNGASRDELTDAIWPDQDPKKTRARLWESASDAKAALGDAWIVDGDRYRLLRERLHIDLDELDQLLSSRTDDDEPQNLEAALALWRGEPLQGCDYAWADGHIHRLQATLIGLLERAGHARLVYGDARGALQFAEQAIALDQFHEASWRLALQADHALGLRESITRRYDQLARSLDQQLGLQPTRETKLLYRQLLGQA